MRLLPKPARRLVFALALAAAIPAATQSVAQMRMPCAERADIIKLLASRYKEVPRAVGIMSRRGLMEVYVSQTGTWSILMTSTKGRTCIIAAGESWEDVKLAFVDPSA